MHIPNDDTAYRVWAPVQTFAEDPPRVAVVAQFRFFQDAIDYAVTFSAGLALGLTGPFGCFSVYRDGAYRWGRGSTCEHTPLVGAAPASRLA